MKLYYVTGISASGKSKVCDELNQRGYVAYDGDEHGITGWKEKQSGEFVENSERVAGPEGSKAELYDWRMSKERVLELAEGADKDFVFVCGTASNRHELWNIFEKVFCLSI